MDPFQLPRDDDDNMSNPHLQPQDPHGSRNYHTGPGGFQMRSGAGAASNKTTVY